MCVFPSSFLNHKHSKSVELLQLSLSRPLSEDVLLFRSQNDCIPSIDLLRNSNECEHAAAS